MGAAASPEWLELRPDHKGRFDEVVARFADGLVHVETMDSKSVYIGFNCNDGRIFQLWIRSGKRLEYYHEQPEGTAPSHPALKAVGR